MLPRMILIDHIFVLESGQYSHNCGPIQHLHHGCNLSSHIPLICNITVPDDSVRLPLSNDNPNRRESHAWYRVTNYDIYSYQNILNVSLHELHNNQNLFQCNDLNCRKTEHLKAITDYCVSLVTYVLMLVQRHFQNVVLKIISNRTGLRWSSHIKTVSSFGIQFGLKMGSLEMVSLHRSCVRHEPNTIILYAGQRLIKLDYDGHAWLRLSHLVIWGIFELNANAWPGHLH